MTIEIDPRLVERCPVCDARGVLVRVAAHARRPEDPPIYACPNDHEAWTPERFRAAARDTRTPGERLALELVNVPRAIIAECFNRISAKLPERGKGIARDAAKATDDTILDFLTRDRGMPPPRDGGKR